jgi:acyl carrier protein
MPRPTRTRVEDVVTRAVSDRLQVAPDIVAPAADLRRLRTFSSFAAVDILEHLEAALDIEVPPEELTAERLCSVSSLTDMFLSALSDKETRS